MKRILTILALTLAPYSCSPAYPAEPEGTDLKHTPDGGVTITLTPAQVAECQAQGGCSVVTQQWLQEAVRQTSARMCGKGA